MWILDKHRDSKLGYGLYNREFKCRCSYEFCQATIVSIALINAYEVLRQNINSPLTINSGFRCTAHNFDEKGTPKSRHLAGQAIDISQDGLPIKIDVDSFIKLAYQSGFKFVKHYDKLNFFHLDVRGT